MFPPVKSFFIGFLLAILLSACSTTKSTTEDEARKNKTAGINVRLALAYLERHDIQRAKRKLLMAQQEGPQLPEVWYATGYFFEATGNQTLAKTYYLKAVNMSPKRGDVQNNYGTFLCRTGQYRQAIEHFQIAAQDTNYLDPSSAYENAGLCSLKIPDREQAAYYFKLALEQDPTRIVSINELSKLEERGVPNGNV